jgi:glycosyltransferase involved in cell wall biosynthesis
MSLEKKVVLRNVAVVIPVYNDWMSFEVLIGKLGEIASRGNLRLRILAVDDGSMDDFHPTFHQTIDGIESIEIIHLIRNLGHQRAIAVGLAVLKEHNLNIPVVVMDSDGEDNPSDLLHLLAEHDQNPNHIIFAHRAHRSENIIFRGFYFLFKLFFRIFTGKSISFGNYSLIPASSL